MGLTQLFKVMSIEIPNHLRFQKIILADLIPDWKEFTNMPLSQEIGADWIKSKTTAILQVHSAIIDSEYNYLLNLVHLDFHHIKLISSEPFIFDPRIKA